MSSSAAQPPSSSSGQPERKQRQVKQRDLPTPPDPNANNVPVDAALGKHTVLVPSSRYAGGVVRVYAPEPPGAPDDWLPKPLLFLAHRGTDTKANVVGPLAFLLRKLKVPHFFDKDSLSAGTPSNPAKMRWAARVCRVGVVLFSEHFFDSPWTQVELATFVHREEQVLLSTTAQSTATANDASHSVIHPVYWRRTSRRSVAEQEPATSYLRERASTLCVEPGEREGSFVLRALVELLQLPALRDQAAVKDALTDVLADRDNGWPRASQWLEEYRRQHSSTSLLLGVRGPFAASRQQRTLSHVEQLVLADSEQNHYLLECYQEQYGVRQVPGDVNAFLDQWEQAVDKQQRDKLIQSLEQLQQSQQEKQQQQQGKQQRQPHADDDTKENEDESDKHKAQQTQTKSDAKTEDTASHFVSNSMWV